MSVNRECTTRGIVVGRFAAGEGSVRVLLYSDALGLVSALAKSAREERSKLRPYLQVGTFGTFTLVKGKDVWRVTGATAAHNVHFALTGRTDAQETGARVLGTVRQFVRGEGSDPYLFSALSQCLSSLPAIPDTHIPAAECLAVLRMLAALGYVPQNRDTEEFLPVAYDARTLARAQRARAFLVRMINEAIAVSGL
ncbi:recombination protein O N-terminal domain-containing protein [Candidatus Kaiserbacteria bacterium]|nr:recombination protein O N-terminal domain-containing protein [Candidatus Kaiserbacteria bacterium]